MRSGLLLSVVVFCCLLAPSFAASESEPFKIEDLKDNIAADNIFVCSDFDGIDGARIKRFLNAVFPDKTHPKVFDGYQEWSAQSKLNVLLFAADQNPSRQSLDCLSDFSFISDELADMVLDEADSLGKRQSQEELQAHGPLGRYHGPIQSGFRFLRSENWLFIGFLSLENNDDGVNQALTNLFGLSLGFCRSNPACDASGKRI